MIIMIMMMAMMIIMMMMPIIIAYHGSEVIHVNYGCSQKTIISDAVDIKVKLAICRIHSRKILPRQTKHTVFISEIITFILVTRITKSSPENTVSDKIWK